MTAAADDALLPARLAVYHPDLVELKSYSELTAELTRPAWLLTHPDVRDDARVAIVMKVLAEHLRRPEG